MSSFGPPVILGSSLSGLLVSQALSRAGVAHTLVGEDREPPEIPRLGESLNDTASPELWRLYGREFREYFHFKNHISYFNGNFTTIISLANPRRTPERIAKFNRTDCVPPYAWRGDSLFHLDRIGFDRAIYRKVRADKLCNFVAARVTKLDLVDDMVERIHLDNGAAIEKPKYVFDNTGFRSLVGDAAGVPVRTLGVPQRVVFTHYRRSENEAAPVQWWRQGTNLVRLDREYDGIDAIAWVIPIGKTLSVGMSFDAEGPRGKEDEHSLQAVLNLACQRRGLDFRPIYPEQLPIQQLRHSYFIRERTYGKNWLLVGGSAVTIWFPSSAGLWTTTAACGMAHRLLENPEVAKYYDHAMQGLIGFHDLLDTVIHKPYWKSSAHVYRFFTRGTTFIVGRVANYLKIKNHRYTWLDPTDWFLQILALFGLIFPTLFFICGGGAALVRSRLNPDRSRQADPFPLYMRTLPFRLVNFVRSLPQFLWALIPRRTLPPRDATATPTEASSPIRQAG